MKRLERGEERSELEDCVLAESVWVLEKGFEVPRPEIARRLSALSSFLGLRCRGKRAAMEALSRFGETKSDIVDCLLAARGRSRRMAVCSFDQDFDELGCDRVEPS
jgi:predicted nucleic-acid-binding protein